MYPTWTSLTTIRMPLRRYFCYLRWIGCVLAEHETADGWAWKCDVPNSPHHDWTERLVLWRLMELEAHSDNIGMLKTIFHLVRAIALIPGLFGIKISSKENLASLSPQLAILAYMLPVSNKIWMLICSYILAPFAPKKDQSWKVMNTVWGNAAKQSCTPCTMGKG